MGKKEYDLSEMYVVKEAYVEKAEEYEKRHGGCAFGPGGQYYDFLNISRNYGLVPDQVYPGLRYGEKYHNHEEMDAVLKGFMNGVVKSNKDTPAWIPGLNGILDAYLGKTTYEFDYDGKYYTPKDFSKELGLNFDDYIIVSSFEDHPWYKESVLEVPDNWAPCTYYNLPVEELMESIDNALMSGYSVAWACDMRGKGFSMKKGVAIVPQGGWDNINEKEYDQILSSPHLQKRVTQDLRQKEFDNHPITGDHGMHIVGIAHDQDGHIFYKVKNSWGVTGKYDGYIYVSREYMMLKTTNCMINKNSLPLSVAQKLGIETTLRQENPVAASDKNEIKPDKVQSPASAAVPLDQ